VHDDGGPVGRRAAEGLVQVRTGPTDVAQRQASAAAVQQGFRAVGPDGQGAVEVVDGRAETAEQVPDQAGVIARLGVVPVQARGPAEVGQRSGDVGGLQACDATAIAFLGGRHCRQLQSIARAEINGQLQGLHGAIPSLGEVGDVWTSRGRGGNIAVMRWF
jgi:hypothetical protein